MVHATAVFRNCPNVSIAQDDLDSVARFITSKDHLVKNIDSIQYDRISNHGMDNNGTYEHSVQVRIAVRRKNLWEGARSYLWKHLAHDLWERSTQVYILQMYRFFAQTTRISCPITFCQNICKYVKIYKIYVKTS